MKTTSNIFAVNTILSHRSIALNFTSNRKYVIASGIGELHTHTWSKSSRNSKVQDQWVNPLPVPLVFQRSSQPDILVVLYKCYRIHRPWKQSISKKWMIILNLHSMPLCHSISPRLRVFNTAVIWIGLVNCNWLFLGLSNLIWPDYFLLNFKKACCFDLTLGLFSKFYSKFCLFFANNRLRL